MRADQQIAAQRQLQPTGQAVPGDLGDGRLRELLQQVDRLRIVTLVSVTIARRDCSQIVAAQKDRPAP